MLWVPPPRGLSRVEICLERPTSETIVIDSWDGGVGVHGRRRWRGSYRAVSYRAACANAGRQIQSSDLCAEIQLHTRAEARPGHKPHRDRDSSEQHG